MDKKFNKQWYGIQSYEEGLVLQNQKLQALKDGDSPFILGLEHKEVLTLGVRSHKDDQFLALEKDFDIVKTKRGGHATIHNPGQLVIYPILPLRDWNLGVRDFVCLMMKATKDLLLQYGVNAYEKEEPGLFTDQGKIALFGIQVRQGMSQHGLSINIKNDLQRFSKIPVCGIKNEPMDKLSHYQEGLSLETLFDEWLVFFEKRLSDSESLKCL